MKKIFTLIAAAAVTLSASAETVIYSWESPEGTVVEVGGKATAKVDETRVNYSNVAKDVTYYTICLSGKKQTYPESNYVNVTLDQPLKAGDAISITAYRNKNVTEKYVTAEFIFNNTEVGLATEDQFPNLNAEGENDDAPGTQTLIVPAEADGCTSFDMTRGSASTNLFITKLVISRAGEAGGDEGGETPVVPAEGVEFEVAGNGATLWGKSFDSITTPFEFDVKSKTATLNNFMGSSSNIVLKYTMTDEKADPMMTDTKFNSAAVSGLGEDFEYYGYHYGFINNFNENIIVKQNGVNFGKFENVRFYIGYASNISVRTDSSNGDVYYDFTIMLGGDYRPWDAEKSDWGEVSQAFESIWLKTSVNVSKATSGIENIEFVEIDNSNAPVEFYNLQGVRINEPAAGQIVIRRQGTNVSKIIVR